MNIAAIIFCLLGCDTIRLSCTLLLSCNIFILHPIVENGNLVVTQFSRQLLKWISSLSIPDNQPLRNWTYLAWCTSNQFFCMNLKHYCCQKRFPTNTQPRGYEYPNNTRIFQDTMYLIKIKGLSAITHPVD